MDRFWAKVQKGGPDACWPWLGNKCRRGFGLFKVDGSRAHTRVVAVHRFSYEMFHGPIPEGFQVFHTCSGEGHRCCVNPAHLRAALHVSGSLTDEERFWSKVDKSGDCWLWQGAIGDWGYGQFSVQHKMGAAHRYAWQITNGPIPPGLCVCHRCDVPACVNPAHLWLGTNQDNTDDKVAKGRQSHTRGEKSGKAKFTDDQVRAIHQRYAKGELQREIAASFGVAQGTISNILLGKTWPHIKETIG